MKVIYHKKFLKSFHKLPAKIKNKCFEKIKLFQKNPFDPRLNNHSVESAYPQWRSINITGDYRALFEIKTEDTVVFMMIGTHSELY
jgi:addiction module RelE/StbE family toxin